MDWGHIQIGNNCPYCSGKQVGLSNCLAIKNPDLAKEWHPTKNGDLTPYNVTWSKGQYVWWKCIECEYEWYTTINNRNNGRGCPKCTQTKGEKQIDLVLTKYNIPHDKQYSFNDLIGVGGKLLRFDIPIFWDEEKTKLRMLIEYDGIFHYEKVYEEDGHETIVIHDELKNKYCKNNDIILLRIPYWDFDNIEEIIIERLSNL